MSRACLDKTIAFEKNGAKTKVFRSFSAPSRPPGSICTPRNRTGAGQIHECSRPDGPRGTSGLAPHCHCHVTSMRSVDSLLRKYLSQLIVLSGGLTYRRRHHHQRARPRLRRSPRHHQASSCPFWRRAARIVRLRGQTQSCERVATDESGAADPTRTRMRKHTRTSM